MDQLELAIEEDRFDLAKELIGIKNYQISDILECKAFSISIERGKPELVELLLKNNPDIFVKHIGNSLALHAAAKYGHGNVTDILLHYKAKVNYRDENSHTPLHIATLNHRTDVVKVLLTHGADVNAKVGDSGQTALHLAARHPNEAFKLSKLLIAHDCDINARDSQGNTPLHLTCSLSTPNIDYIKFLIDNGASVDLENSAGYLPSRDCNCESCRSYYFFDNDCCYIKCNACKFKFFMYHAQRLQKINIYLNRKFFDNVHSNECCEVYDYNMFDSEQVKQIDIKLESEIERLKSIKIGSRDTLFDLLFKVSHYMTVAVGNEDFVGLLHSSNFDNMFANYGYLLKLQNRRGHRRKVLENDTFEGFSKLFPHVPVNCMENIFKYLANADLKNFSNVLHLDKVNESI